MTRRELWESYKGLLFDDPDLGVRLDLSRMGVSPGQLDHLEGPLQKAFGAMDDLEAGGIANPDENRRVGHYWLRAPDLAPEAEIAKVIRENQRRILDFVARVHTGFLRHLPSGAL